MKKKGFTLIELLAVIVVLAIIALIAVPIVLNIIEKTRSGAAVSSARSYIKATETYILTAELNKKDTLEKNNKYNVTKETVIEEKTHKAINDLVDIKGTKPSGNEDYITLGDSYSVVEAKLTINGYEILIENDEVVSITKNGKTEIIEVKSIRLNKESAELEVDQTLQLEVTIEPENATNKNITWTSSNEIKATVDSNGLVIAKGVGNVVITASTSNGESASANIIVQQLLSSAVQVGDYVAYDVSPNSVACFNSTSLKGWRVLKVENNQIYLVHAGQPECYTHGSDSAASVTVLNNLAQ